jgi:hypothetical protein
MKIDPGSLSKAVDQSFDKFHHFRQARMTMMAQFSGRFYRANKLPEDGKASPLNLMYQAVSTLVPNLVFNDPRAKITTPLLAYRDYAELLTLAVDSTVQKLKLRDTLRKTIVDAIFMAGFIKTGLAVGDEVLRHDGADLALGRPYIERVSPDDIVLDPMARDWDEQSFIGNRYRVDVDHLLEMGIMDPAKVEKLADRYEQKNAGAESISGDVSDKFREIARYVDLVDIYLPREGLVCTIPYEKGVAATEFLHQAEYAGPSGGPYHMLAFSPISDNLLPVAPAGIWFDLHTLGNRIARKLARQAERGKRVLAYQGDAIEDAQRIADAEDGEGVKVEDVDKIKEVNYGGATEDSYEWMRWVKGAFSEAAGSIELLQGVNTNSPTATQAEMLQANSSVRLGDMQSVVSNFAGAAMDDVKFLLHTDPLIELPLARRVRGQEQQAYLTPEARVGDWADYALVTKPYSMTRSDPALMVRRRLEFASNVIPAAAQAFQMLGPGFKVGPFLKRMATEVGLEDADEWLDDIAFQEWVQVQAMMNVGDPGKAAQFAAQPPGMMNGVPQPGTTQPNQPVPTARGPAGGISPGTEQASAQQETAGELQGAYPSARALAMNRGL